MKMRTRRGVIVTDAAGNQLPEHIFYYRERYPLQPYVYRYGAIWEQFTTYEEARLYAADREHEREHGIDISKPHAEKSLQDYFERLKRDKLRSGEWCADTAIEYVIRWRSYVVDYGFSDKLPRKISHKDIQDLAWELSERLAPSYACRPIGLIRQALDIAVDDGVLLANPASRIKYKKIDKHRANLNNLGSLLPDSKKPLSLGKEQEHRFFEWMRKNKIYSKWYHMLRFQAITGLRVSEMCGLLWRNVGADTVCIDHQLLTHRDNEKEKYIKKTKSAAGERHIPLTPEAIEILDALRALNRQCRETIDGYSDFVFLNTKKQTLVKSAYNRLLHRAQDAYNTHELKQAQAEGRKPVLVPRVSSHGLRRTYATRLDQAGVSQSSIIKVMGQTDFKITRQHYIKPEDDYVRAEILSKMTPQEQEQPQNITPFDDFIARLNSDIPIDIQRTIDAQADADEQKKQKKKATH